MLTSAAIAALLLAPPAPAPVVPPVVAPPAGTPAFSTISGRPPEPPLKRVDPRIWEARFDASLWAPSLRKGDTVTIQLSNIMVWLPVVLQSTWSQVDPTSIKTEI